MLWSAIPVIIALLASDRGALMEENIVYRLANTKFVYMIDSQETPIEPSSTCSKSLIA